MKFKKGIRGYAELGSIFMLFSFICSIILTLVIMPMFIGGELLGGSAGMLLMLPIVILMIIVLNGWFLFWFITKNKFVR